MMKILFPTNFTDVSLNAFVYTLEFADTMGGEITVFHAYNDETITDENIELYDSDDIKELRERKDGFPIFEKIRAGLNLNHVVINYAVRKGTFMDALKSYVDTAGDEIDLIAMGTRSLSHPILEFFNVRKTEKVLKEIYKPVLVIPGKAKFKGKLDKVLFMVNYKDEDVEGIEFFVQYNTIAKIELHIVHFDKTHTEDIRQGMKRFQKKLSHLKGYNFVFNSVDSLSFIPSLEGYIEEHNIDMVCLLNKNQKAKFFKLSKADMLVESVDIPVLAIYTS